MPVSLNELLSRARPYSPLLLVAAVALTMFLRGLGLGLLVLAAGMLLFAISSLWQSVQSLGDDGELSLEEALALAAPSAEEEKKRSVLRALKDLEYERSVGKISEEDFAKLSQRYRDEARRLLQALDKAETPARARVEKLIAMRMEREQAAVLKGMDEAREAAKAKAEEEAEDQEEAQEEDQEEEQEQDERATCAECGTKNESDARFCKQCGEEMS